MARSFRKESQEGTMAQPAMKRRDRHELSHRTPQRPPKVRKNPDRKELEQLANRAKYKGSPYHKQNPGNDFGVTPQGYKGRRRSPPTCCEWAGVTKSADAENLLKQGIKKGMISEDRSGDFPKRIWSVVNDGENDIALEARLENKEQGIYHGYPRIDDSVGDFILDMWSKSNGSNKA